MILAALYGLAAAFCWGLADFISRQPSQRLGYYLTSTYVQLFSFVGLAIYIFLVTPTSLGKLSENNSILAENLIVGVFMFAALLFLYRGYASGIMSIAAPIASSYPVVTIILSVAVLGITLSNITAFGISIVVLGIILAGTKISEIRTLVKRDYRGENTTACLIDPRPPILSPKPEEYIRKILVKGMDSAILACLSLGVVYFGLGVITNVLGFILPVLVMRGSASLTGFALLVPLKKKFVMPNKRVLLWLLLLGLLDSIGFLVFNLGILSAQNSLPIVVTLSGLVGAITMLFARTIYREKLDKIQNLGVIILLVGVGIILYF